jgi:S1-C subfamily serine protease
MDNRMDQTPDSRSSRWRERVQKFVRYLRLVLPFSLGVTAALLALLLFNALTPHPHILTTREVNDSVNQILASATPPPAYSTFVYQVIRPSLVLIEDQEPGSNSEKVRGLGSGFIIDDAGDILTCLHVVTGTTNIQVLFADGTQSSARVVTVQPENDIAVLQADQLPNEIVPAVLGNPNAMQVGDQVYAVGNPFGLYSSMSAGVISGFHRTFKPQDSSVKLDNLIQIDAAVNPGNSGGPLLNRDGQVIGIVEGILNPTEQSFFVGIGFAMPINIAGGAAGLPQY